MDPLWPGLTDQQWSHLKPLLPIYKKPFRKAKRRGGRPRASDKKAFEALVWALGGGTLERLPPRFGSRRTACRRLARWWPPARLEALWARYIETMDQSQAAEWYEAFQVKRRRPMWQEFLKATFRLTRPDFYRLAPCPSAAASPRTSSMPASPGP